MKIIKLEDSQLKGKRFRVYLDNNKHYDFGLKTGETYIDHKDKIKRDNYRAHKLFFASELQKIEKQPKKLISQDTTENWNQMEIDYQDAKEKELIDEQPKVHQTRSQTKKDALIRNPPVKVHQTRSRK